MKFSELADGLEKLESTSSRLEMTDLLADVFKKAKPNELQKIIYLMQGRISPSFSNLEIGMGEKMVQQALATASGFDKSKIEKLYTEKGDLGLVAMEVMGARKQSALARRELSVDDVFENFVKIATASGSGSQELKKSLLIDLFNSSSHTEAKWIARIPTGSLRLGVGEPTVMDALSVAKKGDKSLRYQLEVAFNQSSDLGSLAKAFMEKGAKGIENYSVNPGFPIRAALGERAGTIEEIMTRMKTPLVEPKMDGFRQQIHKKGNEVTIYSRKQENMTHMFPEVVASVKKLKAKNIILDAEALGYNPKTGSYLSFQETIKRKRKYGVTAKAEEMPLHVMCFDIMYLDGKDLTGKRFSERRKILEKQILKNDPVLTVIDQQEFRDAKSLEKYFKGIVKKNIEGIMAKNPELEYKAGKRGFHWMKYKPSYDASKMRDTVDAVIIGYYKGRGKRTGFGFGGLLTAVYDEDDDEFKSIARVGSGFTEAQMSEFSNALSKIKAAKKPARVDSDMEPDVWVTPKYVVTLIADEISLSPVHTAGRARGKGYALRFPRIVSGGVRIDKNPEQATTVSEIMRMYKQQHTK